MYPQPNVPPGIISRGPDFALHFRNRTGCVSDHVKSAVAGDQKASLNYGSSCGATNSLGAGFDGKGCDTAHRTLLTINGEDREVCNDRGTDACCARHDLIRTGININPLATFSHCKANNALHNCMSSVTPNEVFADKRDISELEANTAAKCIYQVMPCLAA